MAAVWSAPSIGVAVDGKIHIAWSDARILSYTSADGGATWASPVQISTAPSGMATSPSLAVALNGAIYTAWAEDRDGNPDIFVAASTNAGASWGTNVRINDDPGTTDQSNPSLAADSSGTLFLAWQDSRKGSPRIYFAR